jgi:iron(III) transport system ATP-binding protein
MTRLRVDAVTLRYGGFTAVDRVSFVVEPGELVAIVGPSGCGKTSLLRLIAGFERPDSGSIRIDETVVASRDEFIEPERRRVGLIFQQPALFPHMTVEENIAFGVKDDRKNRVLRALELVDLSAMRTRKPHQLSGGQQQRVALARTLAARPRIVLLDEPFANLDARLRDDLRAEVRQILHDEKMTSILVTHDQGEALSIASRVGVMTGGVLRQFDTPSRIYERPASTDVARFLGDGQLFRTEVRNGVALLAFGEMRIAESDGEIEILIRPEDLQVDSSSPHRGVVRATHFFGHDQLVDCVMKDGARARIRCASCDRFEPGDEIGITMRRARHLIYRNGTVSETSDDVPSRREPSRE